MTVTDKEGARELALYAINNGELYRQRTQPVILNQASKLAADTFDPTQAPKIWRYVADDAAQRYTREFVVHGSNGTYGPFNVASRVAAAAEIAEHYREDVAEMAADLKAARENRKTWTRSAIRAANESAGFYFFSRETMRFYGESMDSYAVRYEGRAIILERVKNSKAPLGARFVFNPESGDIRKETKA